MHKSILFLISTMLLASPVFSAKKTNQGSTPFHKGSNTLGLGLGGGVSYDYFGNITSSPTLLVTFDHGVLDDLGPGNLGIGGIVAFKTASSTYLTNYKASWTNVIIGIRGTWHLTLLADKNDKFDPYGGITTGLRFNSYRNTYYKSNPQFIDPYNNRNVYPVIGAFVGAKYNFAKNFGAFAELGYDISFFRGGICLNF